MNRNLASCKVRKLFKATGDARHVSLNMRLPGLFIAIISLSACGGAGASFPMWDDHPANPVSVQAALPPQPDTLMSPPG